MDEIRIVAELEVLPEHREAMLPAFRAMVEASRAEAGNRAYDLTEDLENPCRFFILEAWASDAAIAEHNASAHFKAFGDFQKDKLARKRVTLLRPVC
ncbi:antibiotic biosynthesis monooxygenase [Desulfovibrio sp. PG-178-WT-4]|uniref:Antibiotic biosynthesis monooxygenase n=1 Tax=Desulfovibrio porci TaxID=2605782 RepID=A0A6L5XIC7_9BACT|nr:putative quinol monooxygenase [Desulfovibrio porci]MDY3808536.1 putative quinol monooxygenase [Desulfovibrio porci]MSS26878.1 antibiotic biosynthesis monooxygenase [Desulfovibrio porci]